MLNNDKLKYRTRFWKAYKDYISSLEWKKKSLKWIKETGKCQKCGNIKRLVCHHKTYENFGVENREDIIILCRKCHYIIHDKLKKLKQTRLIADKIEKMREIHKKDILWNKIKEDIYNNLR